MARYDKDGAILDDIKSGTITEMNVKILDVSDELTFDSNNRLNGLKFGWDDHLTPYGDFNYCRLSEIVRQRLNERAKEVHKLAEDEQEAKKSYDGKTVEIDGHKYRLTLVDD